MTKPLDQEDPRRRRKLERLRGAAIVLLTLLACGEPPDGSAVAFADGTAIVDATGERIVVVEGWMSRAALEDHAPITLHACVELSDVGAPGELVVLNDAGDVVDEGYLSTDTGETCVEVAIAGAGTWTVPVVARRCDADDGSCTFGASLAIAGATPGEHAVRVVLLTEHRLESYFSGDRSNEPSDGAWLVLEVFP